MPNGAEIPWELIIGSVAVLLVVVGVIAGIYKAIKRSRRLRNEKRKPSPEKYHELGPVTVDVEGDIEDELRGERERVGGGHRK